MTKVSVIIPTQNKRNSLQRAVKSVLNQSFIDWELYIVNDSEINVKEYDDSRIKVLNNKQLKGGSAARNFGIKYAKGDYIAFLDDDDEWESEKLKIQLNKMEVDNSILSFTGKNIFYNAKFFKYSFNESNLLWILYFYNFVGTTSSIMVLSKACKSIGGFDESLSQLQDYDLYLRITKEGKFSGINKPLLNYYINTSNEHVSRNWKNFAISAYKIWLKQKGYRKILFVFGIIFTSIQKIKN